MSSLSHESISKHNTVNDCWIIIYDKVYDITNFMKKDHSGGYIPLSVAGSDATNLFIAIHPTYVQSLLEPTSDFYKKYYIGDVYRDPDNQIIDKNDHGVRNKSQDDLYFELKKEVEQYMEDNNMKARDNPLFDLQIIFFFVMGIITFLLMLHTDHSLIFAVLHSICFTFTMTSTVHDSNHGALTKNKRWKRYLFNFLVEIVSSNHSWQEKHNLHHMHTNDIHNDPDVDQIIRLSSNQEPKKHHRFQYIYTHALFCLYLLVNMTGIRYKTRNDPEPIHKLYHYPAKLVLCLYIGSAIKYGKFMYWVFAIALSGLYLGTIFSVNHNLYYLSDEYRDTTSFLTTQLTSTSDYNSGSNIANIVTFGLNHQTIHHLFPSIQPYNYPRLTTEVLIPFCEKHNLVYNGKDKSFRQLALIHLKSLYLWRK